MKVSELAAVLGLPSDSDQASCHSEIERRKRAATRSEEMKSNDVQDTLLARRIREKADRGLSTREIAAELPVDSYQVNQILGFAEEIGPNKFRLEGTEYNAEQLRAVMEARGEAEHAGINREAPILGEDVHEAAVALLASRQVFSPTAEQLMDAYEEVGAP